MKFLTQLVVLLVFPLIVISAFAADAVVPGTTEAAKTFWQIIWEHRDVVLLALLSFSEVLALIPSIKQSSIFELAVSLIKTLAGKKGEFTTPSP